MKYFMDTEFLEGTQKQLVTNRHLVGFAVGMIIGGIGTYFFNQDLVTSIVFILTGCVYFYFRNTKIDIKPTIDLISIGIVSEDNREYYAISKDFNLKEAWNRYDIIKGDSTMVKSIGDSQYKVKNYWIRDNVLKPIFDEFYIDTFKTDIPTFNYSSFKYLINTIGKSNKSIAEEIKVFTGERIANLPGVNMEGFREFYTYYGAYDWVVFCWIFGKMIDLPKGFPMFSRDLKVMLDDKASNLCFGDFTFFDRDNFKNTLKERIELLKKHPRYPKQDNEHNALDDAKWNKRLYEFINTI